VNSVGALVPFVLILAAFYLLIIRPARNRQRAQQRLGDQLEVGSRVMTTSGLYAEVVGIEDNVVLLELAPGVTTRWSKPAVARILPEPDAEESVEQDETDRVDKQDTLDNADAADAAPDSDSTERPT